MDKVNQRVDIASGGEGDAAAPTTPPGQDRGRGSIEMRFTDEVARVREDLFRIALSYSRNKHDAEDLVQETYLKAWKKFASFEPGTNIRAWMARIMVNIWIDTQRRATRRVQETFFGSWEEHFAQALDIAQSAEDVALQRRPDDALKQCVRMLPTAFQAVIFYADICQYPIREVAEIERIPVGTAMSRLHRARRRLRSQLVSSSDVIVSPVDGGAHRFGAAASARAVGVDTTSCPMGETAVVTQRQ